MFLIIFNHFCYISCKNPSHPPQNLQSKILNLKCSFNEFIPHPIAPFLHLCLLQFFRIADIIGFPFHIAIDSEPSSKLFSGYVSPWLRLSHLLLQRLTQISFLIHLRFTHRHSIHFTPYTIHHLHRLRS